MQLAVVGMRLCILCEIRPSMKPSFASHTYYKTGSGQKSRNKAARVGTLALFQDQVTLMVVDCSQPRAQTLSHVKIAMLLTSHEC